MSSFKKVYLRRGKEESLKRFHPWIFSGAVEHMDDGIEEGDIVDVITCGGDFIARGHFQRGSIMVRVLTFNDKQKTRRNATRSNGKRMLRAAFSGRGYYARCL